MNDHPLNMKPYKRPDYGVTEKEKATLDALTLKVLGAQHDVELQQAIVDSLTHKSSQFQGYLANATANRAQADNNRQLAAQLTESVSGLKQTSDITFSEIKIANTNTQQLSMSVNQIMGKLIYTAELLNKLVNLVIRKKALNPLISDELVSMLGTAGKDANNAVALTLVALQSTFAAASTNAESEAYLTMEHTQSLNLHDTVTPNKVVATSLKGLLDQAYHDAENDYNLQQKASNAVNVQLANAKSLLNKAQVKLQSLQSGLAAANAAALAG